MMRTTGLHMTYVDVWDGVATRGVRGVWSETARRMPVLVRMKHKMPSFLAAMLGGGIDRHNMSSCPEVALGVHLRDCCKKLGWVQAQGFEQSTLENQIFFRCAHGEVFEPKILNIILEEISCVRESAKSGVGRRWR
jgi:hypothetical protein